MIISRRAWLPTILVLLIPLGFRPGGARAQSWDGPPPVILNPVPKELAPVDFLAAAPSIDGALDPALAGLPRRLFSQVDLFGPDAKPVEVHYRLAYGTDFLYVYVEARGDRLTFNDRAYQNGDGFHLVIARALPGNAPTREFYVAACSAVDRPELEWSRRLFWYYNVDKIFVPMGPGAKLEASAHDGVISFELLLPWQDMPSYHPWLGDGIGFNLGFVKAAGQGALYYRLLPEDLGSENAPRRYLPLRFAEPALDKGLQTYVALERNHARRGETIKARAITLSAGSETETLTAAIVSGEGTRLDSTTTQYSCAPGLTRHEFGLRLGDLPAGGYRLAWSSRRGYSRGDDASRAAALTILADADPASLLARLERARARLSPGSSVTLKFFLEEAKNSLASLYAYETAAKEYLLLFRLEEALKQAEAGRDVFAERTGFFRRAFLSKVDGTLQPYGIRVPAGYDPKAGKKYPLVVYLHGSASDETNLAGADYLGGGEAIEIAPRGRGPSNGWTRDHAQEDIEEAIAAAIASYPIDETRIVLAGFSMGGYGVYRTFYEHPGRYRALAVFSGHPNLGTEYFPGEGHPNFLDEKNLAKFAGKPMFIFHGRQDRNCPFAVTEQVVAKLAKAGARIELVAEDGAGHQRPNAETLGRYHEWLKSVLK